jgi:hypothetical protein
MFYFFPSDIGNIALKSSIRKFYGLFNDLLCDIQIINDR